MKRIVLLAIAAICLSGAANAQQTPYNWSGGYIGANAGALYSYTQWQYYSLTPAQGYLGSKPFSAVFGAHAGYQWHLRNNYVVGIDFTWQAASKTKHQCDAPAFCVTNYNSYLKINDVITLGPRIGYAYGRYLPYIVGGVAHGNVSSGWYQQGFFSSPAAYAASHTGWFAGLGVEYAYTNNIILGLEYQHVELGQQLHSNTQTPTSNSHFVNPTIETIRFRLTWKN